MQFGAIKLIAYTLFEMLLLALPRVSSSSTT